MVRFVFRAATALSVCAGSLLVVAAQAPPKAGDDTLRVALPKARPTPYVVSAAKPDGTIELSTAAPQAPALKPGFAMLVLINEREKRMQAARAEVISSRADGPTVLKAGPNAAKALTPKAEVFLVVPEGSTSSQLSKLPDLVDVAVPGPGGANRAASGAQSANNLKQIGIALHNFHDTYGHFPPAVVLGPDGKPWHSWRVLLLPFLEQNALYEQYDMSQPWDSEKNRAVLEKVPSAYRDPHNPAAKDGFTHYAALVGEHCVFTADGMRMPDAKTLPFGDRTKAIGLASITDGTSNTIGVAPVSPERKIPWTKPEDITVGTELTFGGPNGIAAAPESKSALVLFLDGSVLGLPTSIDSKVLTALATRDGGETIDRGKLAESAPKPGPRGGPSIEFFKDGTETKARIVEGS